MTNLPAETPWWAAVALALVALLIPVVQTRRKLAKQDKEIEKVHHQVANEHSTNLRDDVDGVWADAKDAKDNSQELKTMLAPVLAIVEAMALSQKDSATKVDMMVDEQRMQRKDIGGLREEMRAMRRDVGEVAGDLSEHLIESAKKEGTRSE